MTRQFLSVTKDPYYQPHICDQETCDIRMSCIIRVVSEPNHMFTNNLKPQ